MQSGAKLEQVDLKDEEDEDEKDIFAGVVLKCDVLMLTAFSI